MGKHLLIPGVFLALLSMLLMGQGCPTVPTDGSDDQGTDQTDDTGDTTDDTDDGTDEPAIPGTINERHEIIFTRVITDGASPSDCMACHGEEAEDIIGTGHWKWQGLSSNIAGEETGTHGKADLINNFCIAVPSNEGRCTECHISIGWADNTFDFSNTSAIDCLVCHDTSGTYDKGQTTAGAPVDAAAVQTAAVRVGTPSRKNCGACHFYAGGGDNVKHGDLASSIVSTTRAYDVHMGTDGGDFTCQKCHTTQNHAIAGMALHSIDEGKVACTDCHTGQIHDNVLIDIHLDAVACQTCHIPRYSRSMPTVVEWYWDEAGQDISPIPVDEYGKATYDKKKGRFVWGKNVKPELLWFNGKYNRMIINVSDTFASTPVVVSSPVGDYADKTAKIYPFKKMIGRQPADKHLHKLVVPHLFGTAAGAHPYWKSFDWADAILEGTAYAGQAYSGEYEFVDTAMYLAVNHEIAPASEALGCTDCHNGGIDFTKLGYPADPWFDSPRDE